METLHIEGFEEARYTTAAALMSLDSAVLAEFPVDLYLKTLVAANPYGHYHELSGAATSVRRAIEASLGTRGACLYHKYLILEAIAKLRISCKFKQLPPAIQSTYRRLFNRIVSQLHTNAIGYYTVENDLFLKDLALCRLKLIPCGIALLESATGLPRTLLLRDGPWTVVGGLLWVARNLGGFRPLYGMHLERQQLREFTPEGWTRCYLRIAQMLERNAEIRGVCGSTWWFDPQVASISPELRYLRVVPEENGARCFRIGPDDGDLALRFSAKRRRLFNEGAYVPTNYFMVWPRDALIDWARALRVEALGEYPASAQ